jgi:hypothetical protein
MNDRPIFLLLTRSVETQEVTLTASEGGDGWNLEINYDYRAVALDERFLGRTFFATRAELDVQLAKIIPSFLANEYFVIETKTNFWRLCRPAGPRYIAINVDPESTGWRLNVDCALGHADEGTFTQAYFKNRPSLDVYLAELLQNFAGAGYAKVSQLRTGPVLN